MKTLPVRRRTFLASFGALLAVVGLGCSAGDTPPPCVKTNPEALATLTGRFVEGPAKTPIVGMLVTAGGASMNTGEDGRFTFLVPACTSNAFLRADLPSENGKEIYDDHMVIDGDTWEIQVHGWPVPQLDEGAEINLGDIVVSRLPA
jgi:hypothetical protein